MFDTISNRSNTSSIFEGLLGSAPTSSRASATARTLEGRSFSEQMQETQAPEGEVLAAPDLAIPSATTSPVKTDQNSSRQDSVSGQNSSQPAAAATPEPAGSSKPVAKGSEQSPARTKAAEGGGEAPKTPIEILQDVMKAQGIDPGSYKMESFEEVVMYPGGSFMHRYTQVDLPNGYQEKFSTDLMAKFPEVTVNELARIMKMGGDGPVTGLV